MGEGTGVGSIRPAPLLTFSAGHGMNAAVNKAGQVGTALGNSITTGASQVVDDAATAFDRWLEFGKKWATDSQDEQQRLDKAYKSTSADKTVSAYMSTADAVAAVKSLRAKNSLTFDEMVRLRAAFETLQSRAAANDPNVERALLVHEVPYSRKLERILADGQGMEDITSLALTPDEQDFLDWNQAHRDRAMRRPRLWREVQKRRKQRLDAPTSTKKIAAGAVALIAAAAAAGHYTGRRSTRSSRGRRGSRSSRGTRR